MNFSRLPVSLGVLLILAVGCRRQSEPAAPVIEPVAQAAEVSSESASASPAGTPGVHSTPLGLRNQHTPLVPLELWKEFSGARAMEEVAKEVAIGPRPSGSAEVVKTRELIAESLRQAGWRVELQEFMDETPRGPMHFTNLIARFGKTPVGEGTQAIVCSHYDTKRFSSIQFVGASDGASSSGALVELARVLTKDVYLAPRVELVFFDGEEAVRQFTETDGFYGSRHYAHALRETGRAAQFKLAVLWDMIGDKDLTITLPPDTPPNLAQGIFSSAEALGCRQNFRFFDRQILDDHVPLHTVARVPSIDLIDFDYLPWHTADDTLDKLSPESLQTVGAVTVHYLKQVFPH